MVGTGLEGPDEESAGGIEVVSPVLGSLVDLDLLVEVLLEFINGIFQGRSSLGGFPFALYVAFGVVGVLQVCCVGLPVGLSSYVLGESVYGCVQFGFGECRLEAEFEAIPE